MSGEIPPPIPPPARINISVGPISVNYDGPPDSDFVAKLPELLEELKKIAEAMGNLAEVRSGKTQ